MTMYLNGPASPSVAVFGSIDLASRESISPINVQAFPDLDFACNTQTRSIVVGDDGYVYLLTKVYTCTSFGRRRSCVVHVGPVGAIPPPSP